MMPPVVATAIRPPSDDSAQRIGSASSRGPGRGVTSSPVTVSQMRTDRLGATASSQAPSGDSTKCRSLLSQANEWTDSPVSASHRLQEPFREAEMICLPSGEKAQVLTSSAWPLSTRNSRPEAASQSRSVPSREAETIRIPSGEKAQAFTRPWCPLSEAHSAPDVASQIVTVP